MSDAFTYKDSGLPASDKFENATLLCKAWLDKHMAMFKDKGIRNFMLNQPVRAARLLISETDNVSEASVIVALLGPAKQDIMNSPVSQTMARKLLGNGAVDLLEFMGGKPSNDPLMHRDAVRLFLVEGMSTMNDQLIDRKRIDAHHKVRWNILNDLEKHFAAYKGQNPALDRMFAEDLVKSRAALEALDLAPAQKNSGPKGPR